MFFCFLCPGICFKPQFSVDLCTSQNKKGGEKNNVEAEIKSELMYVRI